MPDPIIWLAFHRVGGRAHYLRLDWIVGVEERRSHSDNRELGSVIHLANCVEVTVRENAVEVLDSMIKAYNRATGGYEHPGLEGVKVNPQG